MLRFKPDVRIGYFDERAGTVLHYAREVTEIVAEYTDPSSEVEPGPDPEISDAVQACPDCDRPNQFGQVCDSCEGDRQTDLLIQSDADGID